MNMHTGLTDKVKIQYYGLIKNIVDREEDELPLIRGATIRDLLRVLVQKYGDGFRSMMLTPEWELLHIALIHVNDHDIEELDGLDTKLESDGEITITVVGYEVIGG